MANDLNNVGHTLCLREIGQTFRRVADEGTCGPVAAQFINTEIQKKSDFVFLCLGLLRLTEEEIKQRPNLTAEHWLHLLKLQHPKAVEMLAYVANAGEWSVDKVAASVRQAMARRENPFIGEE